MPLIAITSCRKLEDYRQAVLHVGGEVRIVESAAVVEQALAGAGGLMLTGGDDVAPARYGESQHPAVVEVEPERDEFEIALVQEARRRDLPIFAICRGVQVLNVALGGSLYQNIPDDPGTEPHGRPGEPGGGRLHDVTIEPGSRLAAVMQTTTATASCHHHQAIDKVGDGLHVVARADDGIVEALELDRPEQWLLAVQWHPEDTAADDPAQQQLFDALVAQTS